LRVHFFGNLLMLIGLAIVVTGALVWSGYGGGARPPRDVSVERRSGFYFPIVTCIVISVLVSLLMWLFRR
jgi:hypothetical protein